MMQFLPVSVPGSAVGLAPHRRGPARASVIPWMGAGILISILGVVYLCFFFGAYVGRVVSAPRGFLAPARPRVSRAIDPSFIRGYTAGIVAGRKAANLVPGPLAQDQIAQAVLWGLDATGPTREYRRAFGDGARAGMAQRLRERFGRPPAAERRALVVSGDILPLAPAAKKKDAKQPPSDGSPGDSMGGGIKRVLHPDGRVEYTNL